MPRPAPKGCADMTIEDVGPRPQSFDLEQATRENRNYRSVAWSGRYLQITLMSIPVGRDVGLEVHPETDQFLRQGRAVGVASDGRERIMPRHLRRIAGSHYRGHLAGGRDRTVGRVYA